MSKTVSIEGLAAAIVATAKEYTEEVEAQVPDVVAKVAKETVRDLKGESPVLTRSYSRGWRAKKKGRSDRVSYVIHNATDYQLTHLLEFGHAKKGGGRVAARPHIRQIADAASKRLEADMRRVVTGR